MTNEISELVQRLVTCAEGDWSENLAHIPMAMREAAKTLHSISEQAAQGWQPIETAPKDGTTIDLWAAGNRIPDAYWGRPEHSCGEYGQHCDCCPDYDGWCDVFGYVTGSEGWSSKEPTHWVKRPIGPPVSGVAKP